MKSCTSHHLPFFEETFGELGFHFFDIHRNVIFGFATFVSLLGVAMLVLGSCALSDNKAVIKSTYWASITATNKTTNTAFSVQAGLSSMVYSNCPIVAGRRQCTESVISFEDTHKCAVDWDNNGASLFSAVCDECYNQVVELQEAIVIAAISKGIALLSMQKRMFAYADSPALKLIGIVSEAMGAASLASGMSSFNRECLNELRYDYLEDDDSPSLNPLKRKKSYYPSLKNVKIQIGPGFVALFAGHFAVALVVASYLSTKSLTRRDKGA